MEKRRRYFPDEFKRQAVDRARTSGLTIMDVAAELGIHETQPRRWIRQLDGAGIGATRRPSPTTRDISPADLAAENARLKRELLRVQTEREILKKAALAIALGPMADNGSLFGAATR